MSTDILDAITKRRSIRAFAQQPVERAKLEIALKAAMAAPSANNGRPWRFLIVTQLDQVRTVCAAHPYARFGARAAAVILPFGEKAGSPWFDQDMAAATENLLIALANLGLGATWCGMDDGLQSSIRSIVGIPAQMHVFALIPVGVPAEAKPARTQYEPERVYWETY